MIIRIFFAVFCMAEYALRLFLTGCKPSAVRFPALGFFKTANFARLPMFCGTAFHGIAMYDTSYIIAGIADGIAVIVIDMAVFFKLLRIAPDTRFPMALAIAGPSIRRRVFDVSRCRIDDISAVQTDFCFVFGGLAAGVMTDNSIMLLAARYLAEMRMSGCVLVAPDR